MSERKCNIFLHTLNFSFALVAGFANSREHRDDLHALRADVDQLATIVGASKPVADASRVDDPDEDATLRLWSRRDGDDRLFDTKDTAAVVRRDTFDRRPSEGGAR